MTNTNDTATALKGRVTATRESASKITGIADTQHWQAYLPMRGSTMYYYPTYAGQSDATINAAIRRLVAKLTA